MSTIVRDAGFTLVDIGAGGGIHPRWNKINPHYKAILFEPDPEEFKKLQANVSENLIVLDAALSDHSGKTEMYRCKEQPLSSVYVPNFSFLNRFHNSDKFKVIRTIRTPVDTLDNQLKVNGITGVDFIKIDVQGHELPILKGAVQTLSSVMGLEVEVEFTPLYENQPLFPELDAFVKKLGFELFDLRRYFWKRKASRFIDNRKGQLVTGEALYFKSPERICEGNMISEDKILRSVVAYLAYGYLDQTECLCDVALGKGILTKKIHGEINLLLNRLAHDLIVPDFKGKGTLHRIFTKIANIFGRKTWFSFDPKLGNN